MKVLVVNSGSSSLKYQLMDTEAEVVLAKGLVERIGDPAGKGRLKQEAPGKSTLIWEQNVTGHRQAASLAFNALTDPQCGPIESTDEIEAVGHRVVHGGEKLTSSVRIDQNVIEAIEEMSALAPLHNPPNLMGIRACMERMPDTPQVAVFDTAFHSTMPKQAYMYALPYELYQKLGIRRYGFHGTSHKYVSQRGMQFLREDGVEGDIRMVTCHLGNGCSATAVVNGNAVDTSMGMTPAEGLVMGTRSGDIDPAILPFLIQKYGWSASDLEQLINKKSGLAGLSGVSNDLRDITAQAIGGNEQATLALDVYCYRIRKYIGAYAAAMGGLEAVVFTGGVGENSAVVRSKCCRGLEVLGVLLDENANQSEDARGERNIAHSDSTVAVLVIPTDEELMIARETSGIASSSQVG